MATIDNQGGSFTLQGNLKIVVPANAVTGSIDLTAAASGSPNAAQGYTVLGTWRIDANAGEDLDLMARFEHPLVGGRSTDDKLRFYARKDDISGGIPCEWTPLPESPSVSLCRVSALARSTPLFRSSGISKGSRSVSLALSFAR